MRPVGIRARRNMLLKVCIPIVFVVTFVVLRYVADPERAIEHHVRAMRGLHEAMQLNPPEDANDSNQIQWLEHRDSLVRLGYLDEVEHVVPLAGEEAAQMQLYEALAAVKQKNWISDWSFRPGSGNGIVITVVDEAWRHAYWKDTIDVHRAPLE